MRWRAAQALLLYCMAGSYSSRGCKFGKCRRCKYWWISGRARLGAALALLLPGYAVFVSFPAKKAGKLVLVLGSWSWLVVLVLVLVRGVSVGVQVRVCGLVA